MGKGGECKEIKEAVELRGSGRAKGGSLLIPLPSLFKCLQSTGTSGNINLGPSANPK